MNQSEGQTIDKAILLGAGDYVFGENFPEGCFDLAVASGKGTLYLYEGDGMVAFSLIGDHLDGTGADGWSGISSDMYKRFRIEGSAKVKVYRASTFNL